MADAKIVMDGGPENDNGSVLKFVTSKSLLRLIARVGIRYSNQWLSLYSAV